MQVSVEKTSELSRKMTVSVPEDVVQEKIAQRLKTLARQVKLDGFRPGKVPQHVVNKLYADRVRGEVHGDIIESTYLDALRTNELKPAGQPNIHSMDATAGFQYTAEFEVYPEVTLAGVEEIEVKRPVAEVAESDVDAMIEKLRDQKKTWQVIERKAQEKDRITIAFSGVCEGENFTNGKVQDFQVEIGAKQMIPGFEDQLIGLAAGDVKSFKITFPDPYNNPKLSGKEAEFEIEAFKVEAAVLPVVDEEFIKDYGTQDGALDTFRNDVKNNMERELKHALQNRLKDSVLDAVYDKVGLTLPGALVEDEIQNLMQPYLESAKKHKVKADELQLPKEMFKERAQKRVALGLILGEIIHANNLKVDDGKVREKIEDMSKSYEQPEAYVSWYYGDKSRLQGVQQMVLEDQTVDWLLTKVKIADEPLSFNDIMNSVQN